MGTLLGDVRDLELILERGVPLISPYLVVVPLFRRDSRDDKVSIKALLGVRKATTDSAFSM